MKIAQRLALAPVVTGTLLLGVTTATITGCDRPAIEEHQEPKASSPQTANPPDPAPAVTPQPVAPANAADAPSTEGEAGRTTQQAPAASPSTVAAPSEWPWRVPESWQFLAEPRPMRLATYLVQGPEGPVEVAISRFPGDVGGMLANVNRWRGQVGLPPTTQGELAGMIESYQSPGFEGSLLHIKGPDQHIVVASLYESDADRTWTVRVSGSEAVATALQEEVFDFARTFGHSDK